MGDVTMIAAQLVGSAGQVTSIDLDQASIETALRRAAGKFLCFLRRSDWGHLGVGKPQDHGGAGLDGLWRAN